jgi:alpha-ketoglutarate-dependent 2,4-dichlorophenoxyacetate dioxygenase
MAIRIRRLHRSFVGEVSGIDIARALSRDEVEAIEAGMREHAVLVFRDQPLNDPQQIEFTRHFGELEVTLAGQMAKPETRRFQQLELGDISKRGRETARP